MKQHFKVTKCKIATLAILAAVSTGICEQTEIEKRFGWTFQDRESETGILKKTHDQTDYTYFDHWFRERVSQEYRSCLDDMEQWVADAKIASCLLIEFCISAESESDYYIVLAGTLQDGRNIIVFEIPGQKYCRQLNGGIVLSHERASSLPEWQQLWSTLKVFPNSPIEVCKPTISGGVNFAAYYLHRFDQTGSSSSLLVRAGPNETWNPPADQRTQDAILDFHSTLSAFIHIANARRRFTEDLDLRSRDK